MGRAAEAPGKGEAGGPLSLVLGSGVTRLACSDPTLIEGLAPPG